MQVRFRARHVYFKISQTAQPVGNGWHAHAHHAFIRIEGHICLEPVGMFFQKRLEMFGTNFLLALEQELYIDWKVAPTLHERFDRGKGCEYLSFHVGGAAPEQQVTAHLWLKGSRFPQIQWIGRLDVIMSIDQDSLRSGHFQ